MENIKPLISITKKGLQKTLDKIEVLENELNKGYSSEIYTEYLYVIKAFEDTLFKLRSEAHVLDHTGKTTEDLFMLSPVTVKYDESIESLRIIMPRLLTKTMAKGQSGYIRQLLQHLILKNRATIPFKPSNQKLALIYVHTYTDNKSGAMDYDNMDTKTIQDVLSFLLIGGDSMKKLNVIHISKESDEPKTYIYLTKAENLMSLLQELEV